MTASAIDPQQTLGELVAERPQVIETLERLRLDYCCGGDQPLAVACRRRGLDPETIAVVLAEVATGAAGARGFLPHDVSGATTPELCDHIVTAHHDRLRGELPRIAELLATVVRVHGKEHSELHDLHRVFTALAHDLLEHIESEEATVFPAARALSDGGAIPPRFAEIVEEHSVEHADAGVALAALRELAGGYATDRAYCGTHRSLLEALDMFELDLHQHVHEENNVLFRRLLADAGAARRT